MFLKTTGVLVFLAGAATAFYARRYADGEWPWNGAAAMLEMLFGIILCAWEWRLTLKGWRTLSWVLLGTIYPAGMIGIVAVTKWHWRPMDLPTGWLAVLCTLVSMTGVGLWMGCQAMSTRSGFSEA